MSAYLVLTDTGHVLATTQVPAWLAHPANAGRVCRVTPLHPYGHDGASIDTGVTPGHMKGDR